MEKTVQIKQWNRIDYDNIFPQINLEDVTKWHIWEKHQIIQTIIEDRIRRYSTSSVSTSSMVSASNEIEIQNGEIVLKTPFQTTLRSIIDEGASLYYDTNGLPLGREILKYTGTKTESRYTYIENLAQKIQKIDQIVSYIITYNNTPPVEEGYYFVYRQKLLSYTTRDIGEYIGTGSAGSNSPNSLSFNFIPKLIIVFSFDDNSTTLPIIIFPVGMNTSYKSWRYWHPQSGSSSSSGQYNLRRISEDGKTVFWYDKNGDVSRQGNFAETVYKYFAIG